MPTYQNLCKEPVVSAPLFCPFCGESFEGKERCPDHEIPLVDFEELQKTKGRAAAPDEQEVAPFSFAFGRGFLFMAAFSWMLGFALPFARTAAAEPVSGFKLAATVALNFWMVPALSVAVVSVLVRRRTLVAMRSARLAVLVLVLGVGASLSFTLYRMITSVERLSERLGVAQELSILAGPYVIGAGVAIALVGAWRLGHAKARAPSYRIE